jgi:hypothetical protein
MAQNTLHGFWGLQFGPWPWEAATPAKSRRAGRAPGRGSGEARPRAHLGPGGDRCRGRNHAGVGARRGPTTATAVARLQRRRELGLDNKRHETALWVLRKGQGRLLDRGRQEGRCSTAAARMAWRRGNAIGGGEMRGIYRRGAAPG